MIRLDQLLEPLPQQFESTLALEETPRFHKLGQVRVIKRNDESAVIQCGIPAALDECLFRGERPAHKKTNLAPTRRKSSRKLI